MNVIESILKVRDHETLARLQCGCEVWYPNTDSNVKPGFAVECPSCPAVVAVQPCTDAQLDAIAACYAATMRVRGFEIGAPEEVAIRRAAAIQDAWRVAFATAGK